MSALKVVFALFLLFALLPASTFAEMQTTDERGQQIIRPGSGGYTPGFGFGGIPFNDSQLYEIPPEKCKGSSSAQLLTEYGHTDKLFLFKTDAGYGVMGLEQTLKELETGVRRKKNCPIAVGIKLAGEIDCRGVRVIKEDPYEGCAFEAKVWGHSLTEAQAFALIYSKLQGQFKEYKEKCVLPPAPKSLKDRMINF